MATVHLGRLLGPVGFSRTVAIKRLHAQFASDPEFVSMFLDEARLAARIRHPNVVPTLDVVATGGELFLVMEYVPGESLARVSRALRERRQFFPPRILSAIMAGVLHGLHAAHEAKDERGHPLGIVHRDMSPQNVLVGVDGVARVLDFGVAKAAGRAQTTRDGQIKGKLSYMPPEQLRGGAITRKTDIYAAGVVLWELLTGGRLFAGDNEGAIVGKVLQGNVEAPSVGLARLIGTKQTISSDMLKSVESLDATVLKALAMDPEERFTTAREMAISIERTVPPATGSEVADWVEAIARDVLNSRAAMVAEIESSTSHSAADPHNTHVQSVLQAKSTLGPSLRPHMRSEHEQEGPVAPSMVPTAPPPFFRTMPLGNGAPSGARSSTSPIPISDRQSGIPSEGPPVTQPSSISVASAHMRSRPPENPTPKRVALAAFVALLLSAAVITTAVMLRKGRTEQPTAAVDKPIADDLVDSGIAATSSSVATSTSGAPSDPVVPPPTPPTPSQSSTASAKPSKRPTPITAPRPTAAPAPAAADCYWFDAQGVKHYKQQCLEK